MRARRPGVEGLEGRRLLAITTVQHPISVYAQAITVGPDGNLWFVGPGEIGAINPTSGFTGEVKLPGTGTLNGIASGKDGMLYVTDQIDGGGALGVFDPATFSYFENATPTKGSAPEGITVAADGTIWFTEAGADLIGSFDPTTRAIAEYTTGVANAGPAGIVVGPDGALWFTEPGAGAIGRLDPVTHASASYPASGASASILDGPDGQLWFGADTTINEIDPTSHAVQSYPSGLALVSSGLAVGPDGHLYYTGDVDIVTQAVGDIDPTTHATAVSVTPGVAYTYQYGPHPAYATGLVAGPDGKLWFADDGYIGAGTVIPPTRSAIAGNVSEFVTGPATGLVVYLDPNGSGSFAPGDPTAVADATGYYTFTGLAPGTYTVRAAFGGNTLTPRVVGTSATVTVAAGALGVVPVLSLVTGSAILPLSYFLTPSGTSNPDLPTAEVNGLYNILFGHLPDATGLANSVAYLKDGGALQALATILMDTAEYETRVVAQDYETFLGRAGAPSEVAAWVNLIRHGTTPEQVADLMLNSSEFNAAHPTDASFVQALYNDLLGRQASDSEVSGWTSLMTSGLSRAAVAHDFVFGAPAMTRAVDGFGTVFWGTPTDAATETYCVTYLVGGRLTLEGVASAFAGSSQFVQRAQSTVG